MKALGIYSDTDSEDLSRRLYSTGLKIALTTVRMNKEIGKYNKLKLKHLDSILGIIENNFDEKNFGKEEHREIRLKQNGHLKTEVSGF